MLHDTETKLRRGRPLPGSFALRAGRGGARVGHCGRVHPNTGEKFFRLGVLHTGAVVVTGQRDSNNTKQSQSHCVFIKSHISTQVILSGGLSLSLWYINSFTR